MTRVTIVGAGSMAAAIGARLLSADHHVHFVAPDESHAVALAQDLPSNGTVTGGALDQPWPGEVVVLAVPYAAALELAATRSADLAGRVVIDICNPIDFATLDRLVTPTDRSAAEDIAALLPESSVVKAFNTTLAGPLRTGAVEGRPLDVLIAGDEAAAVGLVAGLVRSAGLRPVLVGPLRRARQLEHLGLLHLAAQDSLGTQWSSAVGFWP